MREELISRDRFNTILYSKNAVASGIQDCYD
jgi:hypothetical protein